MKTSVILKVVHEDLTARMEMMVHPGNKDDSVNLATLDEEENAESQDLDHAAIKGKKEIVVTKELLEMMDSEVGIQLNHVQRDPWISLRRDFP